MIDGDADLLTVTDLKQYIYCPRITYYERCMPHLRPRTYKMDAGVFAHEQERKRAARRTLHAYGLESGERQFEVPLTSERFGITGKVDEIVTFPGPPLTIYPVDYKLARQVSPHYRLQIAAYALMIEEVWDCDVAQGFVYLIPLRRLESIAITSELRVQVENALYAIHNIIRTEHMPPPPKRRSKCESCEFRRVCNDF